MSVMLSLDVVHDVVLVGADDRGAGSTIATGGGLAEIFKGNDSLGDGCVRQSDKVIEFAAFLLP